LTRFPCNKEICEDVDGRIFEDRCILLEEYMKDIFYCKELAGKSALGFCVIPLENIRYLSIVDYEDLRNRRLARDRWRHLPEGKELTDKMAEYSKRYRKEKDEKVLQEYLRYLRKTYPDEGEKK